MSVNACSPSRALAAAALLCSPALAQTDHWVGPPASGHPFQSIQAAIDASAPGDRVLVAAGTYDPFVLHKPVQVSGRDSFSTKILSTDGSIPIQVVHDGTAGLRRISHFGIETAPGAPLPAAFIKVANTPSPVELLDLIAVRDSFDAAPGGGALLDIDSATSVVGSTLRLLADPVDSTAQPGLEPYAGIRAVDSRVVLSEVRTAGVGAGSNSSSGTIDGAPGIEAVRSTLLLALCAAEGGESAGGGEAGSGLVLIDSDATIHGGKVNRLAGGAVLDAGSIGASGMFADGQSNVTWAIDVLFEASQNPFAPAVAPIDTQPTTGTDPRQDHLPSMWVIDSSAPINEWATVIVEGDPGTLHFWWLTFGTTQPIPLPGIFGPLNVDPNTSIAHAPILIESNGQGSASAFVPNNPALIGLMFAYQSLEVNGATLQLAPAWFATITE